MAYSLNGAILLATGGPTVNEGQLKWFQARGAAGCENYNDAERKFLEVATVSSGDGLTIADLWRKFLVAGAYMLPEGTLNGGMLSYWVQQASLPPAVTFIADQYQVDTGGSVTLQWSIDGALVGVASATPANAQWTGNKPAEGSVVITNLTANQTFTLAATNGNGTTTVDVDIEVVAQTVTVNVTVGQDATPDVFGYSRLSGLGAANPTAIFGGQLDELYGAWNGADTIVVRPFGNVPFPDVGTAQLLLGCPGALDSPYTLTWDGSAYRLNSNYLAYFLSGKVGQVVAMTLEKL